MTASLTITERAADQIQNQLAKRGSGIGIRVGVRKSGCSGYMYNLEYVDEPKAEDLLYEAHGAKVFVDPEVVSLIEGTEMDYVNEGLQAMFRFNNPNVTAECGCGESFSVG
ncbi:iron-sulfur cluster assembly protein [Thiohalorhabdus denitrificans]|uniref:Iron-binding protein IscA n=1 Tax=Thiohalorhabdus denitrificans TaxID=381306 RepID=A0A0P9C5W8_9GAMM|nr:Fe-S cluster assembly scaffold SufA [Thiohalorhabdus denitrificans]KPV40473.1 iron-sulfur cluster assembly protein [Thiohalorhabdus denitrificans]SCY61751.1 Iron-binding apoprotein IscA [Thiohalorhabdus denitrificans]